ncbi:MAG: hypothetical protein ACFFDF_04015, partial [Candidatus Odinarchaeota archaeon]
MNNNKKKIPLSNSDLPEVDYVKDFHLDHQELFLNGVKRHGIAPSVIDVKAGDQERLFDIFSKERFRLTLSEGEKKFLDTIKARPPNYVYIKRKNVHKRYRYKRQSVDIKILDKIQERAEQESLTPHPIVSSISPSDTFLVDINSEADNEFREYETQNLINITSPCSNHAEAIRSSTHIDDYEVKQLKSCPRNRTEQLYKVKKLRKLLNLHNIHQVDNKNVNEAQVLNCELHNKHASDTNLQIFKAIIDKNHTRKNPVEMKQHFIKLVKRPTKVHKEKAQKTISMPDKLEADPTVKSSIWTEKRSKKFWMYLQLFSTIFSSIVLFVFANLYSFNDPVLGMISVYYILFISLVLIVPFCVNRIVISRTQLRQTLRLTLVSFVFVSLFILGIMMFVFNLMVEAVLGYFIVLVVSCGILPFILTYPKKYAEKDNKFPWIERKYFLKKLKAQIRTLKLKGLTNKRLKDLITGILLIFNFMLVPFLIGCFSNSMLHETISAPSIALAPQDLRRNGIDFDITQLEYSEDIEDMTGITFNSMFVLKFPLDLYGFTSLSFQAQLIPKNVPKNGDLNAVVKTHTFSSQLFRGPISQKDVYFKIDLDKASVPVVPGDYQLYVYATVYNIFRIEATSNSYSYNITIKKDTLSFNPYYISDPLSRMRRGSIYSVEDKEALGWRNYFEARAENSLGEPVSGTFSLYLTQREGYSQVYKKITDLTVKQDGVISYCYFTRSHHREYMRGKIEYDGSQSLFYDSTTHYEDADVAKGKLIYTSGYPDNPEYTYEGTDWVNYNTNDFQVTNHLYYHHEFSSSELQWTKSPSYSFQTGTPDFIYLDVSDNLTTYIESPLIGYIGTVADIATFSYQYELFNYGVPNNDIWVEIKSQLFRNGQLVHEQYDYQGYYNANTNWQTINLNLTQYFTEAGQKFQIKVVCDFLFDPSYNEDISIRFDYATFDIFYDPVYYRSFDFQSGFNEFTSPTIGSTEALYWDSEHLLSLGNEILAYQDYPGLLTNNYFQTDFRLDDSWNIFSGLFLEQGSDLIFEQRDDINLAPTWREIEGNSMAVFDLLGVNPPINVSEVFQSVIKDEFVSEGDSDDLLEDIHKRFVTPKIVSNGQYVIIVFAGRYSTDDQWKIYETHAVRPDGDFSTPKRIYDPGDDAIYQLAPSIALSSTDLYVVWQQRNRDTHSQGETEWNIFYGRISLSDFTLKDVREVVEYDPTNLDKTAMIYPDIALTPLGNVYNKDRELIQAECMVHISYENASWTNFTQGNRNNEDVCDINKNIYYCQLSSTYFPSSFSSPIIVNDYFSSGESTASSADTPSQSSDFTLLSGISDWLGDLQSRDLDYTTFFPEITYAGVHALDFLAQFEESSSPTYDAIHTLAGILYGDVFRTNGYNGYSYSFDGNGDLIPQEMTGTTIYSAYANVTYEYGSTLPSTGTGWTSPSIVESISTPDADWINPTYATAQDSLETYAEISKKKSSEPIRATNFSFTIPTGATINGITVGFDRYASASNVIEDIAVDLVLGGNTKGDPQISATPWDTSDDNVYSIYGGTNDLWGTSWSVAEINSITFGVQISVDNVDTSNAQTAYIDHICINITYTEASSPQEDSDIILPDGDTTTQWEPSTAGNHYVLINETTPDINNYIFTSSNATSSIIDQFTMNSFDISEGSVTQIQVKVYGSEIDISSTVDVYLGSWLGSKQLDMSSTSQWYTYMWSGLSASQTDLQNMEIKFESVDPPTGPPTYENFDYVDFGDVLDYPLGSTSDQFMISTWVYPTSFATNQSSNGVPNCFISKDGNLELGINPNGSLSVYLNTNSIERTAAYGNSGSIPLNEWSRIIVIFNQSCVDVYLKDTWFYGALGSSQEPWASGGNLMDGGIFTIGCELTDYSCFTGKLDEIGVYNESVLNFPSFNNLTFTTNFSMDNKPSEYGLGTVKLLYSYKANISQYIELFLFNFNTQQYDLIESGIYTEFFDGMYNIMNPAYYNANYEVRAKIIGINQTDFELNLDMFTLNYSWIIPPAENVINFNENIEVPQIITQICSNTTSFSENSTEVNVNFNQTALKRVFEMTSLSIEDYLGESVLLFNSEEEFVKLFGNNSLLFSQNKIMFPDDLQFHDLYDPRTYYFACEMFEGGTLEYPLQPFFYDNVSLVKKIKDVYYSTTLLSVYEIESLGQRLNRNNYSIIGNYGSPDLNISFTNSLPDGAYFYVKYTLEEYNLPQSITIETSTIRNELALIYERYLNNTNRDIFLDVSDTNFQFQDDLYISNGLPDSNISHSADIKYDY